MTPHTLPSWASYWLYTVRIWETTDHVIMTGHCIFQKTDCGRISPYIITLKAQMYDGMLQKKQFHNDYKMWFIINAILSYIIFVFILNNNLLLRYNCS